ALDPFERRAVAHDPLDVRELRVVLAGKLDHPRRHVESAHAAGARRHGAGEAADPAADLHDVVAWAELRAHRAEQQLEVALAVGPEPLEVRPAVLEAAVDEEERVLARPLVPEAGHVLARISRRAPVWASAVMPK